VGTFQVLALLLGALAWSGVATSVRAEQLLKNVDFDEGMQEWRFYVGPKVQGAVSKSIEDHELRVVVPPGNPQNFVQLIQAVSLEAGKSYRLSFEAKSEGEGNGMPIGVAYTQGGPPFASYGLSMSVRASNDWSAHEFAFTALPVQAENSGVVRLMFGNQNGTIHFRKFSLTPVEVSLLHP